MSIKEWMELGASPYAGVFLAGVVFGFISAWAFISKYIIEKRLTEQHQNCQRQIDDLEKFYMSQLNNVKQDVEAYKVIAEKWTSFMERKALEALG